MGGYAKAEPLFQRALAISERSLGGSHPQTGTALDNLAGLYQVIGAYAKAEPLYRRALAIFEGTAGPDVSSVANVLNKLGSLYQATGGYAEAESCYQRALAMQEKALGPNHPQISTGNLADLYRTLGRYSTAQPLYERSLAVAEKTLGPDHPDVATKLGNLALLYQATGGYAQAEPLQERALAILEKSLGREHPSTAGAVHNLAVLYQATGADQKAEALYQRALAIWAKALGDAHAQTATAMANLAVLYHDRGAFDQAAPLYERVVTIREKALGANHPDTAMALTNLGGLYQATGAHAKAEAMHHRALAIREKALGLEHPDTAATLINLALVYHYTRSYAKAESLNQRALTIFEKALGPDHPQTAGALINLATVYQAMGAHAKSEPLVERAQRIEEDDTVRFLFSGSEPRKRDYLNMRLGSVYHTVSLSVSSPTARTMALGLLNVLQFKGRVLDVMSDSVMRLRRSVAPEARSLLDQLSAVAQQLSLLTYSGPVDAAQYRRRLSALTQEQERLQVELSNRSAIFRQAVVPITLEGVRQALPEDTALVEWFRYEPFDPLKEASAVWGAPRYVAYVLHRGGNPVAIDLGLAQPIEALIAELRDALRDPASATFRELSEDLCLKVFKPLQDHLGNSRRLLLSPDATLNLLPFAALVDDKGAYLAQRFELVYLTSGRDLLRVPSVSAARGSAVVLADPAFDEHTDTGAAVANALVPTRSVDFDSSGLVFTSLAGTAAEANALRSLLKLNVRNVLTGARATEASVRDLHGPRVLHLATHGFFLANREAAVPRSQLQVGRDTASPRVDENPLLRSGLALAGANNRRSATADDGILTAGEVAQLDLLGTQLVVLSACETGLGQLQTGEGVYGLRRALVLAGAQTQVASLWKVPDAATQELMVAYYERLLKGEGRAGALRAAQQAMMENPSRRHPYYWAAFIPIGNWLPLPD
jgi:CHAT domain-containing protein/Tfp pilus assembly protein PilF